LIKFEKFNPEQVSIEKIKHNCYKIEKIGGENYWTTNIQCNEIKPNKYSKITAKVTILNFGDKIMGYHIMSGIHSIEHFTVDYKNLYNHKGAVYIHSNDSGLFFFKKIIF
jgi:hypothetical protein